jgi:uncharacterized membrane protein YesL
VSDTVRAQKQFGEGPLSRAVAYVYSLLIVELLLVVTALPGLVPLVLLGRDASNIPLVAVCAVPLGPAISAALYALHQHRGDLTDLRPAPAFRRGYRMNLRGVLLIWIPWLAWLTVLAVNLAHFGAAGIPGWWAVLLVVVAVAAGLWGANALVIASLFAFRTRDVARLAVYFLVRRPAVAIGNAGLILLAVLVTAFWSEVVLVLLGSVLAAAFLRTCRPMIVEIRAEFTT